MARKWVGYSQRSISFFCAALVICMLPAQRGGQEGRRANRKSRPSGSGQRSGVLFAFGENGAKGTLVGLAQVGLPDAFVIEQGRAGAREGDAARFHYIAPVGDL